MELETLIFFPFGVSQKKFNFKFSVPIELLRRGLTKHVGYVLDVECEVDVGIPLGFSTVFFSKQKILGLHVDSISCLHFGRTSSKQQAVLKVKFPDLSSLADSYSCPGDIILDITNELQVFIQGLMMLFGPMTCFPFLKRSDGVLQFNTYVAHTRQPHQQWFMDQGWLELFTRGIASIHVSKWQRDNYVLTAPVFSAWTEVFDANGLISFLSSGHFKPNDVADFGRIVSELIQLHPSRDYSLILGLLVAYLEKTLKINGENRYKFSIKICNLLDENKLKPFLKKDIYDARSDFFHSGAYKPINTAYEISNVYFLLEVIRRVLKYKAVNGMTHSTFDFMVKP